jgi:hypothetical protein
MKKILFILSILLFSFTLLGCNETVVLNPLDSPTNLRIEGNYLIWDHVLEAKNGYIVSINDQLFDNASNLFDLRSSEVISTLVIGNNTIKVKAKAVSLFTESVFSIDLNYTYQILPAAVSIQGPQVVTLNSEITYVATVEPSLATQEVIWTINNNEIATISQNGTLVGNALGEVILTATVKDTDIKHAINIQITHALATSITISGPQNLTVGQEIELSAFVNPTGAFQRVFWSVDDTEKASINTQGRLIGLSRGVVVVKATSFDDVNLFATYEIEIDFAQPITLSINQVQGVLIDQNITLKAVIHPIMANQEVIWETSDPMIATVSSSGVLRGIEQGEVTITAYAKDNLSIFQTITVFVTDMAVDRIEIYDGISQITNIEWFQFAATVYPLEAAQRVTWSVDDLEKASISSSGLLSIVSGATGVITVRATAISNPDTFATYSVRIIDHLTTITYVSNYQELVAAVNGTANYIKLTQNIDATGQTFTPTRTNFSGIFDGNGYSIMYLNITGTQADIGLFRRIGGHATIKDLTFIDPKITSNQINTGLIAGQINSVGQVTIRNVVVVGLETTLTAGQFTHGGLIAQVTAANTVSIFETYVDYTFKSTFNTGNVGGFVGVVNNNSNASVKIAHSYIDLKVNATQMGQIYGGAIGQVNLNTSSSVHRIYASIRNIGTQNALVNGGLIYSQLNSSGNKHYISQIIYAPQSLFTRTFANNNGNSQVNGATTHQDLKLTTEILELNMTSASRFVDSNPIWVFDSQTPKLTFDLSNIDLIFDEKRANDLINQIEVTNQPILSNITLVSQIENVNVTWTSSNSEVISHTGLVTRQEEDTLVTLEASITVGQITKTKTFELLVLKVVDETEPIEMSIHGPLTLRSGNQFTYTVTVLPENIIKDVTWSIVSGNLHATINQNGVLNATSIGMVTLRATLDYDPNIIAEIEIEIIEPITLSASVSGDGLAINNPAESLITIHINAIGTLYYVQHADSQNADQIIANINKRSIEITEIGEQTIEVTITSGTRLHFVLVTENQERSNTESFTFSLLLSYVLVSNYQELVAALNQTADINIKLTNDIYANGQFTPTKTNRFTGIFDGQGYAIHNLSLLSNGNLIGLFKEIGGNAEIKNITFNNPSISVGHFSSGLIAGRVSSAGTITIDGINVIGLVTTVTSSQWTHGGLIGTINVNNTTVNMTNIFIDYTIRTTSTGVSTGNVGALVGTQFNTSILNVSHVYSDFKVSFANTGNTGQILSAIVGQVNTGTQTNISYVAASIKNIGAASAILNAGIVYSQMNNAGSNHQVSSIVVIEGSQTTKLTNNYGTSINGATTASDARITSEFFQTLNATIADKFVTANSFIWVYDSITNKLIHQGSLS